MGSKFTVSAEKVHGTLQLGVGTPIHVYFSSCSNILLLVYSLQYVRNVVVSSYSPLVKFVKDKGVFI